LDSEQGSGNEEITNGLCFLPTQGGEESANGAGKRSVVEESETFPLRSHVRVRVRVRGRGRDGEGRVG
jgi:hypothetical protein